MKRNIAIVTAMMILFSGVSLSVQAATNAKPPHATHKHHAMHHKTAEAAVK